MRILIYEHICGGGMGEWPLPDDLKWSGEGMLRAVVQDFINIGCRVVTTLDRRVELSLPGTEVHCIDGNDIESTVERLAKSANATLIIAPETGGALERWARRLDAWQVRSLGSSADAVALCGNKLKTFEHLRAHDIRTPATTVFDTATARDSALIATSDDKANFVVKPIDGAGCEGTFRFTNNLDAATRKAIVRAQSHVIQPWIAGHAMSVSFMITKRKTFPLLVADQIITGLPAVRYEGGCMPSRSIDRRSATHAASRAIETVEGLHGFVGVDLVVDPNGECWVIEINPRLTVSYCALRRVSHVNLAKVMVGRGAPGRWHSRRLLFDTRGSITEVER